MLLNAAAQAYWLLLRTLSTRPSLPPWLRTQLVCARRCLSTQGGMCEHCCNYLD